MREIERSAESVEDAIELALAELGVSEQEAQISVVQEPRAGFLGMKTQPAIVRVRTEAPARLADSQPEAAETAADVVDTESLVDGGAGGGAESRDGEDDADIAADFVAGLVEAMGLDADVDIVEEHEVTYIDVLAGDQGDDIALLIGKHGATLDALQELTRASVQRATGERSSVVVDVEDYRKRRRAQLTRRARDAAQRVRRSGKPETLEPMSAFERKIVHDVASQVGGVVTLSEGVEPNRRITIRRA